MSLHQLMKEENMLRAFKHFDTDGSGTISREELRQALKVGRAAMGAPLFVYRICSGGVAAPCPLKEPRQALMVGRAGVWVGEWVAGWWSWVVALGRDGGGRRLQCCACSVLCNAAAPSWHSCLA